MATLQELKKKHRSIKSTEKITKAMKTVSAAKYNCLNRSYGGFSVYSSACFSLYSAYSEEINSVLPDCDINAPRAVFVFTSNKGMCGGFNTELLTFFKNSISDFPEGTLFFPCGKKAAAFFNEKGIPYEKEYTFSDTPTQEECRSFLDELLRMRSEGHISSVYVIYPLYKNVMKQLPVKKELFTASEKKQTGSESTALFVPDKTTVIRAIAEKVLFTSVYSVITETALGAQAATLTTMRSSYDTATKYAHMLETQINRKRQSEVTADVIETAQAEGG